MIKDTSSLIKVNIAVFLFGMAGLIAKLVSLPAIEVAFGRVVFSSITLLIYSLVTKQTLKLLYRKDLLLLCLAGVVLGFHWWSFFYAIQISTVAIGTITFAAFPLFVTFLEPIVYKEKLSPKKVICALIILIGVAISIPSFSVTNHIFVGVLIGLSSSLAYGVLTLINKHFAGKYSGTTVAFYEQTTAAIVLLPFAFAAGVVPTLSDGLWILFMGIITTALAHTLFISSMRGLSAGLAGICSSMETVYGILLAAIFLGEVPDFRSVISAIIILTVVIISQLKA